MNAKTKSNPTDTCETIRLGINAHAKWFYVGRQLDGATPQPVQKVTFEGLLHFVAKQPCLAREAFTCYEAGAFGYYLHRKLTAMGVTNYVVQPQDRDERGKGVKNDRLDALALMPANHRFLRFILPARAFAAVREGTKLWLSECPCGHKQDIWDSGGVRYKAAGEPSRLGRCPACGKATLHKIRKKTEEEKLELP